ncbi:aminoacyl-tRNA hydrolase [Spirochaeta africana]|uniref:Peptidyl-tRNA hydrolase n=1 Tax=Spirochaeta africana (strain ATCC 700263 / DSM 8902 / Z-7692) TaxID=889378 RepID=H9UK87_SPIAZ|nr:aminoacyl-tRNA hydrolase [Spirochaeta africana]AFG37930.1 peptidyl-tRNA hydrolase [Spirochaeta africana DSM 8902]
MRIVIGLGNPGVKYEQTRHNVGFLTLDTICTLIKGRWKKAFLRPFLFCEDRRRGLVLVKPCTYMNRSGVVLPYVLKRWKVNPTEILTIVDNLDLAPGRLRLKNGGSSAGHNGIKSLLAWLPGGNFSRLYIGIGHPRQQEPQRSVVEHVLGVPSDAESRLLQPAIVAAAETALLWAESGTAAAGDHLVAYHANAPATD